MKKVYEYIAERPKLAVRCVLLLLFAVLSVAILGGIIVIYNYELVASTKEGISLRPRSQQTEGRSPDLALETVEQRLRDLVVRELVDKPYYLDHSVTYVLRSVNPEKTKIRFDVSFHGNLKNPGGTDYKTSMSMYWPSRMEKPWAKFNGKPLTAKIFHEGRSRIADFGNVVIEAGSTRYLEMGTHFEVPLPHYTTELLSSPALGRTLKVRVSEDVMGIVSVTAFPIFDDLYFKGPREMPLDEGYVEYVWRTEGTALFSHQGFYLRFNKR